MKIQIDKVGNNQPPCSILIFNQDITELQNINSALAVQLGEVRVTPVNSIESYKEALLRDKHDLVIIDRSIPNLDSLELIHELMLEESEPAVLVVTDQDNQQDSSVISNLRCHRYITKRTDWYESLGGEIRRAIRIKRLELENRTLLSSLTEVNMLLAERNKQLDEYGMVVAHDIRGILGGISMRIECVLADDKTILAEKSRVILEGALKSSHNAINLVQETYNFAKLGAEAAEMSSVDIKKVIDEVSQDLCVVKEGEINFKVGELPIIWGNENLLRRVFINLISNSIKYCDKQNIEIDVALFQLVSKSIGQFVVISVTDNGPGLKGISGEECFQMFRRGGSVGDTDGIGIGLSVVKRILDLHNGKVEVDSQYEGGLRVLITLPLLS